VSNCTYGKGLGKQGRRVSGGRNAGTEAETWLGAQNPEELKRDEERKDLQLSRTRIVNDLATATHPQHRKSLEAALAHLDKKIADLS